MRKASRFVSFFMAFIIVASIAILGLSGLSQKDVVADVAATANVDNILSLGKKIDNDYYSYDPTTRVITVKDNIRFYGDVNKVFKDVTFNFECSSYGDGSNLIVEFQNISVSNENDRYDGPPCVVISEKNKSRYVTINIIGDVSFTAGIGSAAIQIENPNTYVKVIGVNAAELSVTGGKDGAGIGPAVNGKAFFIDIRNLFINADGGDNAAAIGCSSGSSVNTITFDDCQFVNVHGGNNGAGIGGGLNSSVKSIRLDKCSGRVYGGYYGAGIGGGCKTDINDDSSISGINIYMSLIYAKGGDASSLVAYSSSASGIGTGGYKYNSSPKNLPTCNSINIQSSDIQSLAGQGFVTQESGAGIGGNVIGSMIFYNNTIYAVGGGNSLGQYYPGAGIGTASHGKLMSQMVFSNNTVTAFAGSSYNSIYTCDAIGAGYQGELSNEISVIDSGHITVENSNQSFEKFSIYGGTFDIPNLNAKDVRGFGLVKFNVKDASDNVSVKYYDSKGNIFDYDLTGAKFDDESSAYIFAPEGTKFCRVNYYETASKLRKTVYVSVGGYLSYLVDENLKRLEVYRDSQYKIKFDFDNDIITENTNLYIYTEGVSNPAPSHSTHVYKYVCTNNCEICGYSRSTGDNHVYDNPEDTTCNYCGHVREIVCSHNPVAVPDRAATCTVAGLKGKTVCSKCGEVINPGTVIPALSHNIITVGEKEPTCTEDGFTGKVICDKCDTVFHTGFAIPAKGHTKEVINQEPTCTKGTIKNRIQCSDCGILIDPGVIGPALGHSASTPNVIAPTCTKDGSSGDVVCSRCNEKLADATVIPKLGHDIVSGDKEATCTEDGYTGRYVCSRGDYLFDAGTVVKATGHNEVTTGYIAPTCTDNGFTGVTRCTKCNLVTSPNMYIAPTGHNYVVNIPYQAPTCTTVGHTESVWCSNCHDVKTYSTTIPATNHTPVTTGVNKEATCTTPGSATGTKCSVCGYVIVAEKSIPAKGHTEVIDPAVPATSTTPGYTEGIHCSVCNTIIKAQQYIPPTAPVPTPGEEGGVEGFVERLYTVCLGRTSDPTGKADWVKALKDGAADGAKVANGFFFSPEFTNKNLSDDEYVDRLYRTFMDRPGDPDGVAAWVKALKGGATREQVFAGFINSIEWANICQKYGIKSGGSATPTEPKPVVNPTQPILDFTERLYTTCLGRNADPDGKAAWAKALANKEGTGSSVAHGFFFSKEFELANHTDEEFVRRLYLTFMDREPDAAGFQAWVNAMKEDGASREQVFNGFVKSPEFVAICEKAGIIAY
ncbi:MAG: DUF4214 domain-containing protein [Saccharofermentans sp.]|nr:DUF4214 domain-containing protein [Saccharofermentans sp.]